MHKAFGALPAPPPFLPLSALLFHAFPRLVSSFVRALFHCLREVVCAQLWQFEKRRYLMRSRTRRRQFVLNPPSFYFIPSVAFVFLLLSRSSRRRQLWRWLHSDNFQLQLPV